MAFGRRHAFLGGLLLGYLWGARPAALGRFRRMLADSPTVQEGLGVAREKVKKMAHLSGPKG